MAGEKGELWPWESILYWLRLGVIGGLVIGGMMTIALWVAACRPTELEEVESFFKSDPPPVRSPFGK